MSHVFISYTSQDKPRVQRFVEILQQQGLDVWWDKSIPPGKNFDEVIEEVLTAARYVVVVWSTPSVQSKWVKVEAAEGDRRDVLVPVLFDEVRIPLEFRRIQAARLMDWDETPTHPEMVKLLKSVQSLLAASGKPGAAEPAMVPSPPPHLGPAAGFITDYFAGRSLWSVKLALGIALAALLGLLLLSGKVCMGDYWFRIGSWMLEDKVFVTTLYTLVSAAYLWSTIVLFAVSAASDPRYKSLAGIAGIGLLISGLPLYWFTQEAALWQFPWVATRMRAGLSVACVAAALVVGIFLGFLLVRLKRSR